MAVPVAAAACRGRGVGLLAELNSWTTRVTGALRAAWISSTGSCGSPPGWRVGRPD
ncbi:MAG: hypothetical protein KJ954_04535 [Alphaproteobacteria bacterium]|nr:hypothetical protein [Alphaproteobacteria bacterium]